MAISMKKLTNLHVEWALSSR